MQSPVSRVPQQPAATRTEIGTRLTVELASVVAGARRRALRDGDRQIDTAHLLHSLIESDPDVRTVVGGGPQIARVLGYLVQRSIGYGLRWQGSVEDSGTVPVLRGTDVGAAAAAGAEMSPVPGVPGVPGVSGADLSGWSPSAVTAMEGALERAELRGDERAGGVDLLACLAADRECRAVEVLERGGVDTALLAGRISEASRHVSQG
ncbi:peptidase [Streptomyces lunaelactis]|uniref:peptidase n=1 Tax=Streptomyces lunaelactis TaxID=1535768 RepID=UPI002815F175|nr:peptidase [Streptomyces lunaelactis]